MQDIGHHIGSRVDSIGADYIGLTIACELLSGEWIVNWRISSEVTAQFGWSRYPALEGNSISTRESLIVKEEESAVFYNRPANGCAELVLDKLRTWYSAEIVEEGVVVDLFRLFSDGAAHFAASAQGFCPLPAVFYRSGYGDGYYEEIAAKSLGMIAALHRTMSYIVNPANRNEVVQYVSTYHKIDLPLAVDRSRS